MAGIRRWYIYLVTLISLQSLTWGIISLLRNLLVYGRLTGIAVETDSLSWQIAIIIVTLPVFLIHWLWGQRLASREDEEQSSWVRGLYLYGVMTGFLAPLAANSYSLLLALFRLLFNVEPPRYSYPQLTPSNALLFHLIAIIILALLWFYHYRLIANNTEPNQPLTIVRRWYLYGFTIAGLIMTAVGSGMLLHWLLMQIGDTAVINAVARLPAELARLAIGIPLWYIFWRWAQQLFVQSTAENQAALRKFYLYLIIFVSALTAVTATTTIFAGFLRSLLGLPSQGDIRDPLTLITITGILWLYHARVLQQDIRASQEQPKQATIRRLYWYLIAAIGLAAFLVGLGGNISVLIRSFSSTFLSELREQLAWFTAALIAGLPVWILPWRQAQTAAALPGDRGHDERGAIVRKIYLYFYIFVATMTVLASAIYTVYRIVSLILAADNTNLANDLPHAIAYGLMAIIVWLYHGAILRSDSRLTDAPEPPNSLRVAVIDEANGRLGYPLLDALQQALPFATLEAVGFQADALNGRSPETTLAEAELIISRWPMAPSEAAYATAVARSSAHKLIIPTQQAGWNWVGVETQNLDKIVNETVQASRQIAMGGTSRQDRYSIGTIISIIAGVIGLFILMSILLNLFFELLF